MRVMKKMLAVYSLHIREGYRLLLNRVYKISHPPSSPPSNADTMTEQMVATGASQSATIVAASVWSSHSRHLYRRARRLPPPPLNRRPARVQQSSFVAEETIRSRTTTRIRSFDYTY
ncbi:hypothetical protein L1987_35769 [Smallanthus sonchifolius]|uniref:Uncharacterized protein n=1 Tax=Smallanthus sonchifolius TaxID=185202 RepID=A0ACB9HBK1_9ASTR|nr:hypothetical protein L1987_35769 [Smallanthus sonchifolius]